jgi:hypothetical protein
MLAKRFTLFANRCRAECKKERGRSPFTNALPSNDASSLGVPAAQNPNRMASSIYESSRGCIWRRVEGADFTSASPFVGLALPLLPAPRTVCSLRREGRTAFREPLQSIVTTVTVVTMPISMRFLRDGPLLGSVCTVTPIVTEKSPSLWCSLTGVTVVTLVTVLYRLILDKGAHLYFVGPYPFNLTRRTRRTEQGAPYLCDL